MKDKDDWDKPRSHGTGLTADEIGALRAGFVCGRSARDVARDLKCSSRTATKYYGFFAAEGLRKNRPEIAVCLPQQIEGSIIRPPSKARLMAGR